MDRSDYPPKRRVPREGHKRRLPNLSQNTQKVLTYARRALVNDMVNDVGWPHSKSAVDEYKCSLKEIILEAKNALELQEGICHIFVRPI